MWPKVIAQLFELLPHISRMVPLADRYLNQKSSTDQALSTLSDGMRSDLGKVAKAHIDLATRLDEFAAHVGETAAEIQKTRLAVDSVEVRLTRAEKTAATLRTTLLLNSLLLVCTLALLITLLLRTH